MAAMGAEMSAVAAQVMTGLFLSFLSHERLALIQGVDAHAKLVAFPD